jgi:hypothetical protein
MPGEGPTQVLVTGSHDVDKSPGLAHGSQSNGSQGSPGATFNVQTPTPFVTKPLQ